MSDGPATTGETRSDARLSADFPPLTEYHCGDVERYLAAGWCVECGRNWNRDGHAADCSPISYEAWPDVCPYCAGGDHDRCCYESAEGRCRCGCRRARRGPPFDYEAWRLSMEARRG